MLKNLTRNLFPIRKERFLEGNALRYFYSFLFYLILPFAFIRLLWRSRHAPEYRKRWLERLGFLSKQFENSIWVHAVSVGETIAAIPLIKALKEKYPTLPLIVTNMTPTGAERVKATFGDKVIQIYIPYDLPDAVSRFLKSIKPRIAIVMETELWPNLFMMCKERNIPIILANARLSEKSAKGYQSIKVLTQKMLSAIKIIASQGYADADRFIKLGMPKEKITVTGNIKFDVSLPEDLLPKSKKLREELGFSRLIWIAASTHPTEEEIILAAHKKIKTINKNALLILVPRHPNRFDSVSTLIKQQGFDLVRRSQNEKCVEATSVYLADTMGELLLLYSVSDVCFVAGSFAPIGGHNVLEPAVLGKPIITGPELFNFAEISEKLLNAQGMVKVRNEEELADQVLQFFNQEIERKLTGENALRVVEANRGALKKQLDLIDIVLEGKP